MSQCELEMMYENAIVLPRPRGMSIGESLVEFSNWISYTNPSGMTDDDFLKLWQEWISTKK